ncbi:hypothetical protein Btru_060368 [Bulinus truncatus]|nr:hypothetical protein Btru_060368 [Bulinus truncatus]
MNGSEWKSQCSQTKIASIELKCETIEKHMSKVPELKQLLKEKGLSVSGTKSDLLKRLTESLGTAEIHDDTIDESINNIDDILNDDTLNESTKKQEVTPDSIGQASTIKPPLKLVQITNSVVSNGDAENKNSSKEDLTTKAAKPLEIAKLSAEERLKLRASKFGTTSNDTKKQQRAERFGSTTDSSTVSKSDPKSPDELEKLKKRADRFGVVLSTSLSKTDEEEKKRKRAERFGDTNTSATAKRPLSVNSSDPEVEDKKKKRAERFGLTT